MTRHAIAATALVALALAPVHAQRRGAGAATGTVTFAVLASDASGAPIPDVNISLTGAAERTGRTEGGRAVFENLPAGAYRFRFDKDGYISLERELTARGGTPIDVKVTLNPAPPPPKPVQPVAPPPPPSPAEHHVDAKPLALDLPAYIDKNYVGRSPYKATGLSCTTGGSANLLQFNEPVKEHTHADSDEFIYVIAGEGNARIAGADQPMSAGVFLVVPRGAAHSITVTRKPRPEPLVIVSILAGDKCG
jgi:mannose-6-phosphate isomerase-like protein (cupin superfamily)